MALIICLNSRMNTSTEFRPVFICTASVASFARYYVLPVEPVDFVHLGRYFIQLTIFSFFLLLELLSLHAPRTVCRFVLLLAEVGHG